jgi:hypothetical protein
MFSRHSIYLSCLLQRAGCHLGSEPYDCGGQSRDLLAQRSDLVLCSLVLLPQAFRRCLSAYGRLLGGGTLGPESVELGEPALMLPQRLRLHSGELGLHVAHIGTRQLHGLLVQFLEPR